MNIHDAYIGILIGLTGGRRQGFFHSLASVSNFNDQPKIELMVH